MLNAVVGLCSGYRNHADKNQVNQETYIVLDNPGFIPLSRASLMMDLVTTGMVLVLPVMAYSIWLVRSRRRYLSHKRIQLAIGLSLTLIVIAFELHVRMHGWQSRAEKSPYFHSVLFPFLYVHLVFAVSSVILWGTTMVKALRHFTSPPGPSAYSSRHRLLARASVLAMTGTSLTGWFFYYLAFMAK